ncbi:MAG: hypothetical protein RIB45_11480 [Marivibrio sp.]|uniref:hypothetical protein n=1 Tax=Marivibrio sp. TaxID=2039719 RepID=UPI0032F06DDA
MTDAARGVRRADDRVIDPGLAPGVLIRRADQPLGYLARGPRLGRRIELRGKEARAREALEERPRGVRRPAREAFGEPLRFRAPMLDGALDLKRRDLAAENALLLRFGERRLDDGAHGLVERPLVERPSGRIIMKQFGHSLETLVGDGRAEAGDTGYMGFEGEDDPYIDAGYRRQRPSGAPVIVDVAAFHEVAWHGALLFGCYRKTSQRLATAACPDSHAVA